MTQPDYCINYSKQSIFVHVVLISLGALFVGIGFLSCLYNVILLGILFVFASNVIYGVNRWKKRIVFLIFNLTFFTFLISRPTISMFRHYAWWVYERQTMYFALNLLWIGLLFMRIGSVAFECIEPNILSKRSNVIIDNNIGYSVYKESAFIKNLQLIAFVFFLATTVFHWAIQLEKLVFAQAHSYSEIYISYTSSLPSFFFTLRDMNVYGLCIYLATFPKKKWCYVVLFMYVVGTIPTLIVGARNPFVLALIFSFVYFIMRDVLENRTYWVGRFEKTAMVILVPSALIFLSFQNYIRDGQIVSMSVFQSIVDLFYKQGISFEVLCKAYEAIPYLPAVVQKNYTFGPIIDYLMRGSLGQWLFGLESLGSQNSVNLAIYGNSFAHSMSYIAHPEYLQGHGWGSSYLLELYADWGYTGVAVGSIVLGVVLRGMPNALKRGVLTRTIMLISLTSLFFMPRAEATKWFSFIVMMQFWFAYAFCTILTWMVTKNAFLNEVFHGGWKSSMNGNFK